MMPDNHPAIVVVGYLPASGIDIGGTGGGGGGGGGYTDRDEVDGPNRFVGNLDYFYPPEGPDENEIRIDLDIARHLTAREQQAFDKLNKSIQDTTRLINDIPNNAKIRLANGDIVTGQELKDIWAKTDFKIDDVGVGYRNGTHRGEADYNHGDPLVRFNIGALEDYLDSNRTGAFEFLPLHELGHMTKSGRDYNAAMASGGVTAFENQTNEQIANDVAHALAKWGNLDVYIEPSYGTSGFATDVFF